VQHCRTRLTKGTAKLDSALKCTRLITKWRLWVPPSWVPGARMIDKREIIDTATTLGLNPHVVEKDYVLGWMLWGIYNHEEQLSKSWVFKGGTCLKKCFF
ncbi:MAG: hypothetical protein ACRERU_23110, partial [Methylococcales bacterium]